MNNIKIFVIGAKEYGTWLSNNFVDSVKEADLVIFTGGSDVDPTLYDEKAHNTTHFDTGRDLRELRLYEECIKLKKPSICICRGSQFATVMNGGKVIQNVNNHAVWGTHKIEFNDGKIVQMTSTHHQMMFPFNLDSKDYEIIAKAHPKRSDFYQTGFGQYMEEDIPCEPEIVFYPKSKCLAIQGHPEYMGSNSEAVIECKNLIKKYLL